MHLNVFANGSQYGVEASFIRNNTSNAISEVASNVFQLKNNSSKLLSFKLNYSLPAGWSLLGNDEKTYIIDANDSVFVPIRVIPDKFARGGTSYIITVTIVTNNGLHIAAQNWYVSIPSKTNWTVRMPVKHQFFTNDNDSASFQLNLLNEGNSDEEIRLTIIPDRRIVLLKPDESGPALLSYTIPLPAGTDTTILFPVVRKPMLSSTKGKDADLRSTPTKETYSIQVLAKSTTSNGSWSSTAQFTKTGNLMRQNDFAQTSIPLTLEANVYDVMSNGTTMSIDAYGNTTFSRNRLLNYRFQTVFVNNYFNEHAFLGNNHYIGYFDENKSLEIGEVNGWGRSLLSGRGVKGSYRYDKHTLGAMLTRAPGFFRNNNSEGYGLHYNLRLKNLNWNSNYSRNENISAGLGNEIYNTFASVKLNANHQVSGGGGYSLDRNINQTATGYGYDINYSGTHKKINFSAGNTHGSPEYVLARGIDMYTTRTSYHHNQRYSYAFSTQNFKQRPAYFVNGVLVNGNYIRTDRYEFRWGINTPKYSVVFKPSYFWEENQSIRIATRQVGAEYNSKNISNVRFSAMGTMGYAKAVDYSINDFFVSRVSAYARWEKLYLSVRYYYGPVFLAQQKRFINDRINPQSVYLIGTYDYWLNDGKMLIATTGNLLYENYFEKFSVRLRPELFYYTNNGVRFSFYASFFSTSQGANPIYDEQSGREPFEKISSHEMNIGFGVRKQFGIPIPGKKFTSLNAVIFKDLNGNGIQESNEEGVENILVNIRESVAATMTEDSIAMRPDDGEEFISNSKGEITYENIPPGYYNIKCVSLTPNGEWFDAGEQEIKVTSKKPVFIPMTRGTRINGSILVERDRYTSNDNPVDLSRIRVTALDSSGRSYSVLTDNKGDFVINLPIGRYVISVNEAVLGKHFMFTQNKINLDLTKNYQNFTITFNVAERKRKMEIKKFNLNETENNK